MLTMHIKLITFLFTITILFTSMSFNQAYDIAYAQQMPGVDPSLMEKSEKMLEATEKMVETTGQMMEKTEKIVEKTEEVLDKTGEIGKVGGCLIATAAFGSELAPQIQQLRETRDNVLLQTQSGAAFMSGFNSIYYLFSPTVADWERENPIFKEAVKITITPLITTLSILNYVDIDSEAEMLGYGISIILLNIGMYFVAPAFVIMGLKQR